MSRPYRPPPVSRAAATTLCQKCLKRGHYSYECKEVRQERPYVARPSRTQQLLNPRLAPALNHDVPTDLVKRNGLADEILKQKAAEREKQREADGVASPRSRRSSSFSVSTISTRSSRSRSRSNARSPSLHRSARKTTTRLDTEPLHKALKRRLSTRSPSHRPSSSGSERGQSIDTRNVRRRMSSFSPKIRGRDRKRRDSPGRSPSVERRRSRSLSRSRRRGGSRNRRRSVVRKERNTRSPNRNPRQSSRSRSPYRKEDAGSHHRHEPSRNVNRGDQRMKNGGSINGNSDHYRDSVGQGSPPAASRPRSLSPYSKRLALTAATR